jgi:hypothetical protein
MMSAFAQSHYRTPSLRGTKGKKGVKQGRGKERKRETYSGVKVTPVTSSASTILTSGTTDCGRTFGLRGGGVGGVEDLDLVISLAMIDVVR